MKGATGTGQLTKVYDFSPVRGPGATGAGQLGPEDPQKEVQAGELVLLSQDETRISMIPYS
jgi:hypothetical protein